MGRRQSLSPLLPHTHRLNSDQRRLRGCFSQLVNICDSLNLQVTREDLLNIEARIKYYLINRYQDIKHELILKGLYPAKGNFNSKKERLKPL